MQTFVIVLHCFMFHVDHRKQKQKFQKYFLNLILLAVDRSTINKRFTEKRVSVIFFTPEKIKINKKTELLLLGIEILNLKTFFDFWSTEVYNYNFLPLIYWFISEVLSMSLQRRRSIELAKLISWYLKTAVIERWNCSITIEYNFKEYSEEHS